MRHNWEDAVPNPKERKSDRQLVLEVIPGTKMLSSIGTLDSRLFKGENELHAIMDPRTCLWFFRYKCGVLPDQLKPKFTSFAKLFKHAEEYFKKRNVRIKEVLD